MIDEWKPYPKNRKIKFNKTYAVILPEEHSGINGIPLFCEVCKIRYGHKDDEISHEKFGCCTSCADTWAYSNAEKWKSGWRPTEEMIKIIVDKRSFIDSNITFE